MNCQNCKYCVELRQGHEIQKSLVCVRHPPTAHLIPQAGGVGVMAINPPVSESTWCGEYKEKESAPSLITV